MNVEVVVDNWGEYKKGDIITDMPTSTARACIAHKVVKNLDADADDDQSDETNGVDDNSGDGSKAKTGDEAGSELKSDETNGAKTSAKAKDK